MARPTITNSVFRLGQLTLSGGTKRLVVVFVAGSGTYGTTSPTAVTFNGQDMTYVNATSSARTYSSVWVYVVPDALGAGSYTIAPNNGGRHYGFEIAGSDLTINNTQVVSTGVATSLTTGNLTVTDNSLCLSHLMLEDGSMSPASGETELHEYDGCGCSKKEPTVTGTTTMGWSFSSSRGSLTAAVINPPAGGGLVIGGDEI